MNETNAKLAAAAQTGHVPAFTELVTRHAAAVHAISLSTTRDWNAADDLTQETFLVAWKNFQSLRTPEAFPAWLRRIARNLSINWIRSNDYRRKLAERHTAEHQNAMPKANDPRQETIERREELLHALDEIPQSVREVMVMFYLEEKTIRETAVALGLTENAVKKRLQRGRLLLRSELEKQWTEETRKTRSTASLDERTERIAKGLAIGPVVPEIGRAAAQWNLSLWVEHALHTKLAATLKPALAGGTLMTGKHIAIGLVVIALSLAGFYWAGNRKADAPETTEVAGGGYSLPSPTSSEDSIDAYQLATEIEVKEDLETGDSSSNVEEDDPESIDPNEEPSVDENLEEIAEDDPVRNVEGIVVDQFDQPVEGAEVIGMPNGRSFPQGIASSRDIQPDSDIDFVTNSGPFGGFRFEIPASLDRIRIFATSENAQGFGRSGSFKEHDVQGIRVVVKTGVPLEGRVLTKDRRPVEGASVHSVAHLSVRTFEGPNGESQSFSAAGGPHRYARTDEAGYFAMIFEEQGAAALRVISTQVGETFFPSVPIGADEIIDLVLDDPAILDGRVTYTSGAPAPGVVISANTEVALSSRGSTVRISGTQFTTQTDSEGYYEFASIPANVDLKVSVQRGTGEEIVALAPQVSVGPLAPGESFTQDFEVGDLLVVRGRVLGEKFGAPVPLARVTAFASDDSSVEAVTVTDVDGRYELTIPGDAGEYRIVPHYRLIRAETILELMPAAAVSVDLSAIESTELDLYLSDPFSITLQVVDLNGQAIAGADVAPQWHRVPNSSSSSGRLASTDADGRFHWDGFGPIGTYSLSVTVEGYLGGETENYEGAPGASFDGEQLVLYRPSSLEGFAVGSDGAPLANQRLRATAYDQAGIEIVTGTIEVGDDGYFSAIRRVPATTAVIELRLTGVAQLSAWESAPIAFPEGAIVDLGRVQFQRSTQNSPENEDHEVEIRREKNRSGE